MISLHVKTRVAYVLSFLPFVGFVPMVGLSQERSGWVIAFGLYLIVWAGVWLGFTKEIDSLRPKHIVIGVVAALLVQVGESLAIGCWLFCRQYDGRGADGKAKVESVGQSPAGDRLKAPPEE